MRIFSINDDGEGSVIRYLVSHEYFSDVTDEIESGSDYDPALIPVTDPDLLESLALVIAQHEKGESMSVDKYGNFYRVSDPEIEWAKYMITME